MTAREQLLKEIAQAPEALVEEVLPHVQLSRTALTPTPLPEQERG